MTRPMTGQPKTEEELAEANRRANESDDEVPEDIKNHPLTRESLKDDDSVDDTLEELREFKETVREQGNDELGVYGEPQTDDETTMAVTDESGDTHELTEEEVNSRRDVRERTWKLLDRKGGMYVKVAHWFNDADVNKVKSGRGFHGFKVGETEKALQIEVPGTQGRSASKETVWVPKKAATVYKLT